MTAPAFEPRRFGAYTLEARLGHGGMAEVFRANREGVAGFARTCVIKRILGQHNEDPSFVDMFINEAKIASKLTHPNIVQVYELGQVDGEFFIAMEYVKGRDLLRMLRELAQTRPLEPAIPFQLSAYIARETCRALQHAHEHIDGRGGARPIIHRDISPQNIMLSYDGTVKLVDFGIAKALGSMREETRTGALKGKFAYMAPEQVGGQSPGPSADVFSAGVVLHEMLTGRRLFKGTTDYDTLSKVRTMVVPPPSTINPLVPIELDEIVLKSLERDRGKRYEKASQMARDLDGVLQTARFAVDEMAEFMRALFPAEPPEVASTENITKEYQVTPSRSSGEASARSYSRAAQLDVTPTGGTGGRRAVFVAFGLATLVGTGAVFLSGIVGKRSPAEADRPIAPMTTPKMLPGTTPAEVIQLPPEMRTVRLVSEPTGARIYEGPRLIGETPMDLKLAVDSAGISLTLVQKGRADLTYLVRPADAPEITLRLAPAFDPTAAPLHATHPPAHGHPPGRATGNPKVEIFDDSTAGPRPKVDALDD